MRSNSLSTSRALGLAAVVQVGAALVAVAVLAVAHVGVGVEMGVPAQRITTGWCR